jgi:hypothetical protein
MSRACGMNEEEKCIQVLGCKTGRREIISNAQTEKKQKVKIKLQAAGLDGVDWTDLVYGMVKWLALVHVVMKLHIP